MSIASSSMAAPIVWSPARLADYAQLCRPRIAVMVLITVFLGSWLAAVDHLPGQAVVNAMISTTLVTAAASVLNQWMERHTDARMTRTANRPLPSGRLAPTEVLTIGVALGVVGLVYQWLTLPLATVTVTGFTLVTYLAIYTPAKRHTTLNTLIGAVPGALPPVIGWTAVRGQIDLGAATLFLILFIWQVPHFLAIAWMYREDYARAGHKMLTIDDTDGMTTSRQMLIYLAALVPVSLLAATVFGLGRGFTVGAILLAVYWLRPILAFRRQPDYATAKRVLRASIVYLPGLLALLAIAKQMPSF